MINPTRKLDGMPAARRHHRGRPERRGHPCRRHHARPSCCPFRGLADQRNSRAQAITRWHSSQSSRAVHQAGAGSVQGVLEELRRRGPTSCPGSQIFQFYCGSHQGGGPHTARTPPDINPGLSIEVEFERHASRSLPICLNRTGFQCQPRASDRGNLGAANDNHAGKT
jgi:hypothetical protein